MKNLFSITDSGIRCDIYGEKLKSSIDDHTGEKVWVCRNCYSEDYAGYVAYDSTGVCIGIYKAFVQKIGEKNESEKRG